MLIHINGYGWDIQSSDEFIIEEIQFAEILRINLDLRDLFPHSNSLEQ